MNLTIHNLKNQGITQSLLSNYMTCPQKFVIAVNQYRSIQTNTSFGTFFHNVLELWYLDNCSNKKEVLEFIDAYIFSKEVENSEYMRISGAVLFENYVLRYGKEKVSPEILFDTKNNPYNFRLRGKIDGVLMEKKQLFLLETKTKTQINEEGITNRLVLDWQSLFYVNAYYRQFKVLPAGVVYNVIRYPQRMPKDLCTYAKDLDKEIKSKPDYFFYRWKTEYTLQDIVSFNAELLQKLIELDERKVFYKNQCSCDLYGGCDYLEYCSTGKLTRLKKQPHLFMELDA